MEIQGYFELYIQILISDPEFRNIEINCEPLPGETEEEALFKWLLENEIIYLIEGSIFVNEEKAFQYDPNLLKFLEALIRAEAQYTIDSLEEKGLVASSVNSNGEIVYFLTSTGQEVAKAINENN